MQNGKLSVNYNENDASDYMKNDAININVNISSGSKNFTVYTMDFTKRYIEINSDYRSWLILKKKMSNYKSWLNINFYVEIAIYLLIVGLVLLKNMKN